MASRALTPAAKEFFGLKEGQKIKDFTAELRELTEEDKADLAVMLSEEMGTPVKP